MRRALACAALVCAAATSARADPVTVEYAGVVRQLLEFDTADGTGTLGGAVALGDSVLGMFTYDSATGDLMSASLRIGGVTWYSGPGASSAEVVEVRDGVWDEFDAHVNEFDPSSVLTAPAGVTDTGLGLLFWGVVYTDTTGDLYSGTALPTSIDLADFDIAGFQLRTWFPDNNGDGVAGGAWGVLGDLVPIPEPSSVALLGAVLLALLSGLARR